MKCASNTSVRGGTVQFLVAVTGWRVWDLQGTIFGCPYRGNVRTSRLVVLNQQLISCIVCYLVIKCPNFDQEPKTLISSVTVQDDVDDTTLSHVSTPTTSTTSESPALEDIDNREIQHVRDSPYQSAYTASAPALSTDDECLRLQESIPEHSGEDEDSTETLALVPVSRSCEVTNDDKTLQTSLKSLYLLRHFQEGPGKW